MHSHAGASIKGLLSIPRRAGEGRYRPTRMWEMQRIVWNNFCQRLAGMTRSFLQLQETRVDLSIIYTIASLCTNKQESPLGIGGAHGFKTIF